MKPRAKSAVDWYRKNKPRYDDLVDNLKGLIKSLLVAHEVPFASIQGRSKSIESFAGKIVRKSYSSPETEVTDLAGLRVVTLIESDIERVAKIVTGAFRVHADFSIDKSQALGADRMGYRSLHLICDLGEDRLALPEFRRFSSCKFEVQIRTSLQHAWAEIQHDRSYKLQGALPSHLQRKFALLAGLLELADTEFDELTQAIDSYNAEVAKKANEGDLGIELNSSSVRELLVLKFDDALEDVRLSDEIWRILLQELKDFGIDDLRALDSLLMPDAARQMVEGNPDLTVPGLVRDAMLLNDVDRYFDSAWKRHWDALDRHSYRILCDKYGIDKVNAVLEAHEIVPEGGLENSGSTAITSAGIPITESRGELHSDL